MWWVIWIMLLVCRCIAILLLFIFSTIRYLNCYPLMQDRPKYHPLLKNLPRFFFILILLHWRRTRRCPTNTSALTISCIRSFAILASLLYAFYGSCWILLEFFVQTIPSLSSHWAHGCVQFTKEAEGDWHKNCSCISSSFFFKTACRIQQSHRYFQIQINWQTPRFSLFMSISMLFLAFQWIFFISHV